MNNIDVRKLAPEDMEKKVVLPIDENTRKDPTVYWAEHYLFKLNGKWYEHEEANWREGGHNSGAANTWERKDLDDRKVDELIEQRIATERTHLGK